MDDRRTNFLHGYGTSLDSFGSKDFLPRWMEKGPKYINIIRISLSSNFLLDFFVGSERRDNRMNWNLDFFSMHSKWISLTSGVGSHGFTREMKPGFRIVFCQISTCIMVRRIKLIVNKT